MTTSVIVFEINEIDGMKAMMPQIKKEWYDELIIVDGGSTDGTLEYAKENGYDIFVQKEKGVGAALHEAMQKVTGDIIIIYAPDGSFLTDRIPMIKEKIAQGFDIVNVSRYMTGAQSFDDNFFTGMGNWFFTWFANIVFGSKLTDFLYTYLGFKRSVLEQLDMNTKEITWGQILLLRALKKQLKIIEIPGDEHARIGGDVKVAKLNAAKELFRTIFREKFSGAEK